MVMQIFQISFSLEATKNIFINSLAVPAFWGLLRYEKRGLGLHYFQLFERRKKTLIQDSDVLVSCAEWIHDPIFVEYSRVCCTDPGFSTTKSLNSFSIRKTKGKLLKAVQRFELNWCNHKTILCLFLCSRQHDKRCTNLHNKCPSRLTNISPNLDMDILLPWPHRREGCNLIWSIGHTVFSLSSCFSVYRPFSFSHESNHAITQRQWEVLHSISPS